MGVKTGQAITKTFTVSSSAGAATDADSTPVGVLYVNGTANGATVTVTNIDTGFYKAAVTLPSLTNGDSVDLRVTAVVSGVTAKARIWESICDHSQDDVITPLVVVDGIVDDILVDTGTTIPATLSSMNDKIDIIDGVVDDILVDTSTTLPAFLSGMNDTLDAVEEDTSVTLPALIEAMDPMGVGDIVHTYTVSDSSGNPLENVYVRVTTDISGSGEIRWGTTNSLGRVQFNLDAGTYYFWCYKSGYNFNNPDTEVVS